MANYKPSWDKDWVINWNPCYVESIEQVWNKYHGVFCGHLVVQFLNENVVRHYMNELLKEDELYFGICCRFVNNSWFHVDLERLANCTSINEYLSITSQMKDGINHVEAKKLLYQWVATISSIFKQEYSTIKREHIFWKYNSKEHRVIYAWGLDTALYYLMKMNLYPVVEEFLLWDQSVYTQYYSHLNSEEDSPENQEKFVDFILEMLPKEYKYLTCLDNEHYDYAFSAGQPFTKPRIKPRYHGYENMYPQYIDVHFERRKADDSEDNNVAKTYSSFSFNTLSIDEINDFVNDNPQLKMFAEKLGLEPISGVAADQGDFTPQDDVPF